MLPSLRRFGILAGLAFFVSTLSFLPRALAEPDTALLDVVRSVAAERGEVPGPGAVLSATPVSPAPPNISTLRPLQSVSENPYIARLVTDGRTYLASPAGTVAWPKLTAGSPAFFNLIGASDQDTRGTGARLEAFLWLFTHPDSPLRHDPALLAAFLRRAHAYTDGISAASAAGTLKAGQLLLDDFAIAPASCALREFAALYPGLLLPCQRASWDRALRIAADTMMGKADGRPGTYANIDLALSFQLLNFGLHLKDKKLLARSRELLHAQSANILPDGGTHYIGSQNESPGYHDVVAHFIARTYEITGDEAALAMLHRLEWYGPVSVGRHGEYWTSPSWKHTWNGGEFATGGEPIVSISGNPWVRGLTTPPGAGKRLRNWEQARAAVAWWRADIAPLPMPDNYTIPDRNIAGPRAWYGRFNYAATLRPIPVTEPGIATLIGAQVLRPDFSRGVMLMGVYPRVYLGGDRANPRSFAWLTSGLESTSALGRTWSAFSASYQLHTFGSSTKGKLAPWRGRQLWLGLPDRIIGVLDIAPESSANAPATASTAAANIEGLIRLGTGGTVTGPKQSLVKTAPGRYSFGDLLVALHETGFASASIEVTPFRIPSAPFADLVLSDATPISGPRRFVVEVRPSYVTADAVVRAAAGTEGLRVVIGDKTFTLRPDAPLDPAAPDRLSVEVASPDAADHAPAWSDFPAMLTATSIKPAKTK